MKKLIIIASLLVVSLAASAQVAFGIKAGFVTSLGFEEDWKTINTENLAIKSDQAYGFDVGLMLRLGYRFYAQIETNYHFVSSLNQVGTNIGNTFNGGPVQEVTQHSINVPVLAGVKLVETRNFNLRLMVGPTFNFNLTPESEIAGLDNALALKGVDSDKRICSFGLDCGIGMDVWVFSIDARYRLVQPGYAYSIDEMKLNTSPINSFEVSLGWKFFDKTKRKLR
jgi:hypothetical protein